MYDMRPEINSQSRVPARMASPENAPKSSSESAPADQRPDSPRPKLVSEAEAGMAGARPSQDARTAEQGSAETAPLPRKRRTGKTNAGSAPKKGAARRGGMAKGGSPKPRQLHPQAPVRPTAGKAKLHGRHVGLFLSFLLLVIAPIAVSGWYLWGRAADQYASYLGFSVRSETGATASELLGGLGSLMGVGDNSTSDTDILYKFIQSHDLVDRVDKRLNLREIWSKAPNDPVFSYTGNDTLEDLLSEWESKVRIYYDSGMIDLRVLAFDPQDAQAITQAIYDESTVMINQLNDIAREDALRYAKSELEDALIRLKEARQKMTEFRNRHQMVDPTADVQGQVGVVNSLQQKLAEGLVQLGLLKSNAQPSDPRIEQAELLIKIIREQITDERQKLGSQTASGEVLSELVGQFESLAVDREFAERTYTATLAAYDTARAEATRQSRYLAAYVKPTLAQEAEYPERQKLLLILSGFVLLLWTIGVLIYYSLRDRR